ncbi:putative phosphodiesterase [Paraburkholderia sp. WC7.3g]|uniref:metallophosphoesterase n=1 Tax=Paraburkholderia sp. WC7.3g TaxID=2991070 RepID=UPI003D1BF853
MKLLVLSDLHNEFEPTVADAEAVARADVVVLAGDIDTKDRSVESARAFVDDPAKPIILVAGNHEFYQGHFDYTLDKLRERAHGTNLYFLENDVLVGRMCRRFKAAAITKRHSRELRCRRTR